MAWAYGLGMGCITQWMLILGMTNLPYNFWIIHIPLLFVAGLGYFFKKRKRHPINQQTITQQPSPPEFFLWPLNIKICWFLCLSYLLYQIYFIFIISLQQPISSWDAIYFIAKKAKVFFYDHSMRQLPNFPWAFYPFHVTLAETWYAFCLGKWHETWIQIIFPVTFLSLAIIIYDFLRRETSTLWAMGGIMLLTASNLLLSHATISYSDLFQLFYFSTTILCIILWGKTNEEGLLIIASLLAGFGTFCKLEGLFYFGIAMIILNIVLSMRGEALRTKGRTLLRFIFPGISIYSIFLFYKWIHKIPAIGRLYFDFTLSKLDRLPIIFTELVNNLFFSNNWGIIWFLLVMAMIINYPKIKNQTILLFTLLLWLCFSFLIFLGLLTSNFEYLFGNQRVLSSSRLLMHFMPFAAIITILLLAPLKQHHFPLHTKKNIV